MGEQTKPLWITATFSSVVVMTDAAPTESDVAPTESLELTVVDDAELHRFELRADGQLAAFVVYRFEPPATYAFTHTETRSGYAGQGLASALVTEVLNRMRTGGQSVLPYCPFVNSYLRKHPEYADLVPAGEQHRFGVHV
jgi:predicted GNAT family acetyltransferase